MANKPIESNSTSKTKSKGSPFLAALFKVLGTLIIVMVLVVSVPAALPRILGFDLYNIVSGSMEPTIPVGAAVYVQPTDASKLEVGNIIAFEVNGDVVVHRVTENDTQNMEIHTKGDANDAEDMWGVPYNNVYGRVRVSVRMLGSFLDFATSATGKLFVFVILFAGIMFSILGKLLTPPDEFLDYDEPKEKKSKNKEVKETKEKVDDKPKTSEEPVKTMSESTGIKKTITVEDAVNNTVDPSIMDSEPSYEEAEINKPITLKDLAKRDSDVPRSEAKVLEAAAAAAPVTLSTLNARKAEASAIASEPVSNEPVTVHPGTVPSGETSSKKPSIVELAKEFEEEKKNAIGYKPEEIPVEPIYVEDDKKAKNKKKDKKVKEEKPKNTKEASSDKPKSSSNAENDKYKKMLSAIIVIIIILILALLGVVGTIFFINYRYSKMDEVNDNVVNEFTSEATEDEVIEVEEVVEEDKFVLHTTEKCPIDVDFEALWEVNPDVVGWIYCEDTVINYPILQGEDDEYYLHHDINGKTSSAGCIFVDANNMKDFSDVNSILYGHHMKNGSMFAGLQKWEEQEYYDAHKYMWLITPDGNYEVWLFSGYLTDAYSDCYLGIRNWGEMAEEYITTEYNKSDFVSDLKLETMLKCEDDDQRHVMLSTCEYEFQNARYVLHGKLVKETPGIYGNDDLDASGNVIEDTSTKKEEVKENDDKTVDENKAKEEAEVNFENLAEIKKYSNTFSNNKMGEYSVHRFDSALCTTEFLTKWYNEYIKVNDRFLWNVIYYSDKDDNSGVYFSNNLLEKDVILGEDGMLSDIANETQYLVKNNELEEIEVP